MMANNYFRFKEFTIFQEKSVFKVGTDGVLLGAIADVSNIKKVLDIGTGTGLISLMVAQRCDAEIVSIEPDPESFNEACENVAKSNWKIRIRVLNTDLQNYSLVAEKFDLIVTNPPYFSYSLKNPDPRKSAARHNESLTTTVILNGVSKMLEDNGRFELIMPYVEGNIFISEAQEYGFYCNKIIKVRSLPTSEVRRLVLSFSRQRLKPIEKFLTIERGPRHEFTEEYVNLTKDFYLKF